MVIEMDQNKAISLSISIIHAYCRKDLTWIPEYLDEQTLFIGPRKGQFLSGGTDLTNAWLLNHPMADFSVSDISASSILTSPSTCEVVLHYDVTWHKDDKTAITHPQTMQVSWFLKSQHSKRNRKSYKVALMHISNPLELDERDLYYNTFGDIGTTSISSSAQSDMPSASAFENRKRSTWIMIHGYGAVLNRYPSDSILYIESASKGKRSIVHTRDQDIHCIHRVKYFMEEYPGIFIQPSVSYIVNPLYIKKISRFQAELWNGRILHIPEKRYTSFKKDFESFFKK